MFHDASSSSSEDERKPFNPIKAAAEAKPKMAPADPDDPLYKAITASLNNPAPRPESKPTQPKRHSRYIGKLVEMAAHRKEEGARVSERRLLAKQTEDEHMFADKERFVTSAYRKKLKEDAIRDQSERKQEQVEQEKRAKGMGGFYENLFSAENVAIRANVEQSANEQSSRPQSNEAAGMKQVSTTPVASKTRKRRRTRFGDAQVVSASVAVQTTSITDKQVDIVAQPKPKPKKRGLRRNDAKSIEEYRRRYFERRAKRLDTKTKA